MRWGISSRASDNEEGSQTRYIAFCMCLIWNEKIMFDTTKKLIEEKISKKELISVLCDKFGITKNEVNKRIRSMFGMSIEELLTPTKEELTRAILQSDSINELKDLLKKTNGLGTLYDKYYGVSTFASARIVCENYREVTPYNPTKADNLSILISQSIGDGCIEYKGDVPRYSIAITHSYAQFDYLVEKVKMINKAYPTTPPVGSIKKYIHSQSYPYFMYRTNKMDNSDMRYVYETKKSDLIFEMTPLGMFLLYMDDGSLVQNPNSKKLTICNGVSEVRNSLQKYLATYGIESSVYDGDMVVCMSNVVSITKFLNNFVIPFKQYIPECMEYKTKLKV